MHGDADGADLPDGVLHVPAVAHLLDHVLAQARRLRQGPLVKAPGLHHALQHGVEVHPVPGLLLKAGPQRLPAAEALLRPGGAAVRPLIPDDPVPTAGPGAFAQHAGKGWAVRLPRPHRLRPEHQAAAVHVLPGGPGQVGDAPAVPGQEAGVVPAVAAALRHPHILPRFQRPPEGRVPQELLQGLLPGDGVGQAPGQARDVIREEPSVQGPHDALRLRIAEVRQAAAGHGAGDAEVIRQLRHQGVHGLQVPAPAPPRQELLRQAPPGRRGDQQEAGQGVGLDLHGGAGPAFPAGPPAPAEAGADLPAGGGPLQGEEEAAQQPVDQLVAQGPPVLRRPAPQGGVQHHGPGPHRRAPEHPAGLRVRKVRRPEIKEELPQHLRVVKVPENHRRPRRQGPVRRVQLRLRGPEPRAVPGPQLQGQGLVILQPQHRQQVAVQGDVPLPGGGRKAVPLIGEGALEGAARPAVEKAEPVPQPQLPLLPGPPGGVRRTPAPLLQLVFRHAQQVHPEVRRVLPEEGLHPPDPEPRHPGLRELPALRRRLKGPGAGPDKGLQVPGEVPPAGAGQDVQHRGGPPEVLQPPGGAGTLDDGKGLHAALASFTQIRSARIPAGLRCGSAGKASRRGVPGLRRKL